MLTVAHLRGKEPLGCIRPTEKVAIGLSVQAYLPFYFLCRYQREDRVVLASSGEFNLAQLSKISKALNDVFMATVHQHVS
jgi:hypothetical protein